MTRISARWRQHAVVVSILAAAGPALAQSPSPAEMAVTSAEARVAADSKGFEGYNQLALALARRARETADPVYYDRAEKAIAASLELSPGNFEAQKVRAWVLLGKHDFARALELALALNEEVPDDVLVYGLLTDAHVELGNYKEAEEACQWMLDLRPGNVPGLTRAAYLRELFGDIDGAIELFDAAYRRIPAGEVEDRAWILTQAAHLELARGRVDEAGRVLEQALELFPDYHYALANLAKVRTARAEHQEAIALLRRHYEVAPHPENLYLLAEALDRGGRAAEAKLAYAEFEEKARAEMGSLDNANLQLILYYVDHGQRPDEALHIAEMQIARRQDVHTLDAYAWALSAAGRHAEARARIDRALAVGIRDATMLYHAGIIAARSGRRVDADAYLKQSLDLAPASEVADAARQALAR
jgi:tetratricopeptide (TPR) repeat protein